MMSPGKGLFSLALGKLNFYLSQNILNKIFKLKREYPHIYVCVCACVCEELL